MNICSIWLFAEISDDFYYLDIWQCARYFVAAFFKELASITIREMWGLESRSRTSGSRSRSRSRLLWQSLGLGLGLVTKFEPGLGLGGYGLDYITDKNQHLYKWRHKTHSHFLVHDNQFQRYFSSESFRKCGDFFVFFYLLAAAFCFYLQQVFARKLDVDFKKRGVCCFSCVHYVVSKDVFVTVGNRKSTGLTELSRLLWLFCTAVCTYYE